MNKYRVSVYETSVTNGWVEVEAEDEHEAVQKLYDMENDEIRDVAEWGSCGDSNEIDYDGYVELVHEVTVSEGLWK